jgi:hypothetical protein
LEVVVARFAVLIAVVILAGCAGATGAQSTFAPTHAQSIVPPIQALAQAQVRVSSATCDKGVRLLLHSGSDGFRMPRCTGWQGQIRFPVIHDLSRWTVTTSVTNSFGAPAPPSGKAIFYMQLALRKPAIWDFSNGDVNDTVTSPAFTSSHTYTLMVYNFVDDDQCDDAPCPPWLLSLGSPHPGSHSLTFSSPLNGAVVSGNGAPTWQFIQD